VPEAEVSINFNAERQARQACCLILVTSAFLSQ
jgi:hypothetical protein